jgi:hypothetical protein
MNRASNSLSLPKSARVMNVHAQGLRRLLELLQRPGIGRRLGIVGIVQDGEVVTRHGKLARPPPAAHEVLRGGLDREFMMLGRDLAGGDRPHAADPPMMGAALEIGAQQRGL